MANKVATAILFDTLCQDWNKAMIGKYFLRGNFITFIFCQICFMLRHHRDMGLHGACLNLTDQLFFFGIQAIQGNS